MRIGQQTINIEELNDTFKNKNITITTFGSSHILNSIGSQPADQTAQIVGGVIGGIPKLVAIALGTGSVLAEKVEIPLPSTPDSVPPPPSLQAIPTECLNDKANVCEKSACVSDLKAIITKNDLLMVGGLDDATQKKATAANQAALNLISDLQAGLSFSIKTTIDPGLSPRQVDPEREDTALIGAIDAEAKKTDGHVETDGLVAAFCPSENQLIKLGLISFDKSKPAALKNGIKQDEIKTHGVCSEKALPEFLVNIYLDFANAQSAIYTINPPKDRFEQTDMIKTLDQTLNHSKQLYRDPAFIPVEVWQGKRRNRYVAATDEGKANVGKLLTAPINVSFGQFGVPQALPLDAGLGENLQWEVTFLESGQVSSAKFAAMATASAFANLFGAATSAANSIATEKRNAETQANTQEETLAAHSQADADAIYQAARDVTCQTKASACTAK